MNLVARVVGSDGTKRSDATLPRLSEDVGYQAAERKLQELHGKAAETEARKSDAHTRSQQVRSDLDRQAQSLLDTGDFGTHESREAAKLYERCARELSIIHRAIDLQKQAVGQEHARASAEACVRVRPLHYVKVRRIAAAMRELEAAMVDEQTLFSYMYSNEGGFNLAGLRDMSLRGALGEYGFIAAWLGDAEAYLKEHGSSLD